MRRIPWNKLAEPHPDHRYVVSVGAFVVDRPRSLPAFLLHSLRVRRTVRRAPGMVGFALVPDFRRRTFTEIAAFESREAMRAFGSTPEHAAAIKAMLPHMAPGSKMVSIELYGRDLPPRPEVAKAALEATPGIEELGRRPGQAVDGAHPHHPSRAHEGASSLDVPQSG